MIQLFLTSHYYIRELCVKHSLLPNEHFMNALANVCCITGADPEKVVSVHTGSLTAYSRHLVYWLMVQKGYTCAEVADIIKADAGGVRRAVQKIRNHITMYDKVNEHTRLLTA